ncbi:MAG: hypothetical protein QM652_07075 [Legionella sp.]|uniref:hypothetical protein n=1 Tax=Legionella sp. TaxID=459 RepID=UPI0039E61154
MMDFLINENELAALSGLLHIQQLAYLRGIRPYMDVKTGIVGVKRKISYQSLAEQLYVEPHQGIKSESFSRAQIRRAVSGLARVGIISFQSEEKHLILKCNLATLDYFVQNKVVTNPSQKAITRPAQENCAHTGFFEGYSSKPGTEEPSKADIPLYKDNYYIFLLSQFEQFWNLYPLKKSQQKAWEQFQALNPNQQLCSQILNALQAQITFTQQLKNQGQWVAPWKYPANWLAQHCWNDELTQDELQENSHANNRSHFTKQPAGDGLWDSCKSGLEDENNVIDFFGHRSCTQAY